MMEVQIVSADMEYSKEDGYLGHVAFEVANHKFAYEITLHSKRGYDWDYSLNFLNESGREEDILVVEEALEEDDELFDKLVEAAKSNLAKE
jgi:hypothetical protein